MAVKHLENLVLRGVSVACDVVTGLKRIGSSTANCGMPAMDLSHSRHPSQRDQADQDFRPWYFPAKPIGAGNAAVGTEPRVRNSDWLTSVRNCVAVLTRACNMVLGFSCKDMGRGVIARRGRYEFERKVHSEGGRSGCLRSSPLLHYNQAVAASQRNGE